MPSLNVLHATDSEASLAWSYDWNKYTADQRLSKHREDLFSNTARDEVEVWQGPRLDQNEPWNGPTPVNRAIKGSELTLPFAESDIRDTFFVIRQSNSWGCLWAKADTFDKILSSNRTFAYFMKTVHGFGYRSRESTDMWAKPHWRRISSGDGAAEDGGFEICYTLRFYERNNRGGTDPWSLRQAGVYQRAGGSTANAPASWIILQYSNLVNNALVEKVKRLSHYSNTNTSRLAKGAQRHILLHLAGLHSAVSNWVDYLDYQATELLKMERKAQSVDPEEYNANDYQVAFRDRQLVQAQRSKLMTASTVLDSALEVGEMIANLHRVTNCNHTFQLDQTTHPAGLDAISVELHDYLKEVGYYKRMVVELLERCTDTASLLSGILDYRNSQSTLKIAQQGKVDSINIRALTMVATLYLPASLLTGIFSSNLVQAHTEDDGEKRTRFVLARDFWKFVLVLIPMILGTFIIVVVCRKISARSASYPEPEPDLENARGA